MTSDTVAFSPGNNEARRKQTVAQIRAGGGGGGGSGADITLVNLAPAAAVNEVRSLCNFPLDAAAAAESPSGGGRRSREKRSPLCGGGRCWGATKSEGIEGWVTDEKAART